MGIYHGKFRAILFRNKIYHVTVFCTPITYFLMTDPEPIKYHTYIGSGWEGEIKVDLKMICKIKIKKGN